MLKKTLALMGIVMLCFGAAGFAANRRTPGGPVDRQLPVLAALARERLFSTALNTAIEKC